MELILSMNEYIQSSISMSLADFSVFYERCLLCVNILLSSNFNCYIYLSLQLLLLELVFDTSSSLNALLFKRNIIKQNQSVSFVEIVTM